MPKNEDPSNEDPSNDPAAIEVGNIQAMVGLSPKHPHRALLFLRFTPETGASFKALVALVTPMAAVNKETSTATLAITAEGMKRLYVVDKPSLAPDPYGSRQRETAFDRGAKRSSWRCGDQLNWHHDWKFSESGIEGDHRPIDALLMVSAETKKVLDAVRNRVDSIKSHEIVHEIVGISAANSAPDDESFPKSAMIPPRQFRDGIQRVHVHIKDAGEADEAHSTQKAQGTLFVEGEDYVWDGEPFSNLEIARGASYLAMRLYELDDVAFESVAAACRTPVDGTEEAAKVLQGQSQLIGRWPNGYDLIRHPTEQPNEEPEDNERVLPGPIDIGPGEPRGCPMTAHVLRMRDKDPLKTPYPIFRRSFTTMNGELAFCSFQSSLSNQFEHLLSQATDPVSGQPVDNLLGGRTHDERKYQTADNKTYLSAPIAKAVGGIYAVALTIRNLRCLEYIDKVNASQS